MTHRTEKQKRALWEKRSGENLLSSLAMSGGSLALGSYQPTFPWLRHLHHMLFIDVLDDAGELRRENRDLGELPCCRFEYIEEQGNTLMAELVETPLETLTQPELALRMAWLATELTVLAPFRCGNDRTIRLFIEHLVIHAGYDLHWQRLEPEAWHIALEQSLQGEPTQAEVLFAQAIVTPQ